MGTIKIHFSTVHCKFLSINKETWFTQSKRDYFGSICFSDKRHNRVLIIHQFNMKSQYHISVKRDNTTFGHINGVLLNRNKEVMQFS